MGSRRFEFRVCWWREGGRDRTRIFSRRKNAEKFIDRLFIDDMGRPLMTVKLQRREVGCWEVAPREPVEG